MKFFLMKNHVKYYMHKIRRGALRVWWKLTGRRVDEWKLYPAPEAE